ncbi:MAG: SDR family oxidoreductase [Pseudomonadota bacterium]
MDLKGKIALVTGGRRGIGKAIAEALHEEGCRVAIADIDGKEADEVAKSCGGFGEFVDVTNEGQLATFLTKVEMEMGPIDVCVSNAGIARSDGPTFQAAGAPNAIWESSWQVNVMSSVYLARHLIPGMTARKSGIFVVVASAAGLLNQMGSAPYSATKHAAVSFAESLAITHAEDGLKVLCVCPQGVRTELIKGAEVSLKASGPIIEPPAVASEVMNAIADGRRYVFTHEETQPYFAARANDPEGWIDRMIFARSVIKSKTGNKM